MNRYAMLLVVVLIAFLAPTCSGQDSTQYVDEVKVEVLSATTGRLTWKAVKPADCGSVVYSIFRGTSEDFTPSLANRIANGLIKTTYVDKVPSASKDYYYFVHASVTAVICAPRSGTIVVYPFDLGRKFSVTIGDEERRCAARSTSEIECVNPASVFHAAIAQQGAHEYLIGCRDDDYEGGDWTCINLPPSTYQVEVHSLTVIVRNSGAYKVDSRTNKKLEAVTPRFSVLARLR